MTGAVTVMFCCSFVSSRCSELNYAIFRSIIVLAWNLQPVSRQPYMVQHHRRHYWPDGPGLIPDFCFRLHVRTGCGVYPACSPAGTGVLAEGLKQPERQTVHLQIRPKLNMCFSYTNCGAFLHAVFSSLLFTSLLLGPHIFSQNPFLKISSSCVLLLDWGMKCNSCGM
jgi:hypothetical protein